MTTATGRRAAIKAAVVERPAKILAMIAERPMRGKEVSQAFGIGDTKTIGRMLTAMKREGKAQFVVVGINDWLWVAVGSPAEAQAIAAREANVKAREKARRERVNARMKQLHARQARKAAKEAREQRAYAAWLYPVRRAVPAGVWRAQVPAGAIRSVFELGAA